MARFYGTVQGNKGEATRTGTKQIVAHAASWKGAIKSVGASNVGKDAYLIKHVEWERKGDYFLIASGHYGKYEDCKIGLYNIPLKTVNELGEALGKIGMSAEELLDAVTLVTDDVIKLRK